MEESRSTLIKKLLTMQLTGWPVKVDRSINLRLVCSDESINLGGFFSRNFKRSESSLHSLRALIRHRRSGKSARDCRRAHQNRLHHVPQQLPARVDEVRCQTDLSNFFQHSLCSSCQRRLNHPPRVISKLVHFLCCAIHKPDACHLS